MSVTVVVGGQFGSEGKGKVAQYLASEREAAAVVRVGGSNSGHTGFRRSGELVVLRHLPTAALLPRGLCCIASGSYIDADVLIRELAETGIGPDRLIIDRKAMLITADDRELEASLGLRERIGSTASGTGAAVQRRVSRSGDVRRPSDVPELAAFIGDVAGTLRSLLDSGKRVIVEGTQGFGLSLLHSPFYPYVTSRDTTAAGAISEAGLSPLDVDEVVLVIRSYPIRVAGSSGPLADELGWPDVTAESGYAEPLEERTSVTQNVRRVGRFDAAIVKRAIVANAPSTIVLNHVDYVDAECRDASDPLAMSESARRFVHDVSDAIGRDIDMIGVGPTAMAVSRRSLARIAS